MTCSFRNFVSPYIDGELDRPEEEKMKMHLKVCSACQGEMNLLLEIRDSLRRTAALTKAPPLLKDRILGEIPQARRKAFVPQWNFAYGIILVAVLLTLTLIFSYRLTRKESFGDVVALLVKYHTAYTSGEKVLSMGFSDPRDARRWLENRFGGSVFIPNAAFAGYNLEGGDLFREGSREFAYLNYEREGRRIGYAFLKDSGFSLNLPENVEIGGIKIGLDKKNEINLAAWRRKGIVYIILTTEDRSELIEYTQRCIQLLEDATPGKP